MKAYSRRHTSGFTVIELITIIVILLAASLLFFYQKSTLEAANLDERRKTAINAIYYNLEEVYFPKNNYYPSELTSSNLGAVDPALLVDTNGVKIDDTIDTSELDDSAKDASNTGIRLSEYTYEPVGCDLEGKCKGYTLRVNLTKEGEYTKKSRNN